MITGKTKLLGVVGYPVEHSRSPAMHNCALNHLGLDYVYLPFPVAPDALADALKGFEAIGLVGFNLTIPHKQTIIPLLDHISPVAQAIGAVNTVWRTEKGWEGTNTDAEGFIAPLKTLQRPWPQITPLILGNGGAARAVLAGCSELGCAHIKIVGRDRDKLTTFQNSWHNSPLKVSLSTHVWNELPSLLPQTELIINTTPLGMFPNVDTSPLPREWIEQLPQGAIAYDLIYTPKPTLFLQWASDRGLIAIDGTEMLVQQGAAALRIWLQKKEVPVDKMLHALL